MWKRIVNFILSILKGHPERQAPNQAETPNTPANTPIKQENPLAVATAQNLAALYSTIKVNIELGSSVKWHLRKIDLNAPLYRHASRLSKEAGHPIPWEIIAVIHLMEAGGHPQRQILNGEKWANKTRLVPKGLGPWPSWASSALSGIEHQAKDLPPTWSIGNSLDFLEKWNGLGYRKHHQDINTPYLWAGSNHYTKGKYVADGQYSSTAVSKQLGAAIMLKHLNYKGIS